MYRSMTPSPAAAHRDAARDCALPPTKFSQPMDHARDEVVAALKFAETSYMPVKLQHDGRTAHVTQTVRVANSACASRPSSGSTTLACTAKKHPLASSTAQPPASPTRRQSWAHSPTDRGQAKQRFRIDGQW